MTEAGTPTKTTSEVGKEIKRLRLEAGKGLAEFAEEVGISAKHLNNIESGRMKASTTVYRYIASLLKVDADELLGGLS